MKQETMQRNLKTHEANCERIHKALSRCRSPDKRSALSRELRAESKLVTQIEYALRMSAAAERVPASQSPSLPFVSSPRGKLKPNRRLLAEPMTLQERRSYLTRRGIEARIPHSNYYSSTKPERPQVSPDTPPTPYWDDWLTV